MGIRDKKLHNIISAMLKAEVAGIGFPEVGTPQGGLCKVNPPSPCSKPFFLVQLCIVSEDIYESYSQKYLIGGAFMDKTYLPDLISELEKELLRLGYTKGSMTFYRRRWNQLMACAEDLGECYYRSRSRFSVRKKAIPG